MEKMDLDLIFQICICVDDMDAVLNNWRKYFNINEDSIIRKSTKEIYDRGEYHCGNYMGKPCEYFHKYYRLDLGGLDLEIIEPITKGPGNPYSDFLAEGGNGIHHLGVKFRDRGKLVKNMEELRIPVMTYAYQGPKTDDMEARSDCYFYDLREMLGVVFEAGGAVVGPLATDPRAGDQKALARLNSYAARPELPPVEQSDAIEKMDADLVFRVSVCVSDMDAVLNNWRKYFNIDESTIVCGNTKECQGGNHAGKECGFHHKFCRFDLGGIGIEIIEPLTKEPGNPYSDFLIENGGNGVHHIAVKFRDREKLIRNMKRQNISPLTDMGRGTVLSDGSGEDCCFYDLREMLGLIVEAF